MVCVVPFRIQYDKPAKPVVNLAGKPAKPVINLAGKPVKPDCESHFHSLVTGS